MFKSVPHNVKFPLARRLIEKSFTLNFIDNIKDWLQQFLLKETPLNGYCGYSIVLCCEVLSRPLDECKELLEMGADPDFYMDLGHNSFNVPPVLLTLASDKNPQSTQKISLLLKYGSDVNILPSLSFCLAYDGLRNSCICSTPTPLAVAIAYDNTNAVSAILPYKPTNPCLEELFLSKNPTIKQCVLANVTINQEDLNAGLVCALATQNENDVKMLLEKGAQPQNVLTHTVNRTLNHCLHPKSYKDYNSLSANPGSVNFRGYLFQTSNTPIPTTHLVEELCQHQAYDEKTLNKLHSLKDTADALIKMLEVNKPQ